MCVCVENGSPMVFRSGLPLQKVEMGKDSYGSFIAVPQYLAVEILLRAIE